MKTIIINVPSDADFKAIMEYLKKLGYKNKGELLRGSINILKKF
jgi:hypothetical protein